MSEMPTHRFERTSLLPVPAESAYAWHTRPGAFERLTPPWENVRVVAQEGPFEQARVTLRLGLGPFHQEWVARHHDAVPGRQFVDTQERGPFAAWEHTHLFEPAGTGTCHYTDRIHYRLPFGAAGALAAGLVAGRLERTFRYRHATVRDDLLAHGRFSARGPLTIAVTGATGMIGRALAAFLSTGGHRVLRIVRRGRGPEDIIWDPAAGRLDPAALDGVDAVVHLAGEPIAGGRWSEEHKRRIRDSRVQGTTLLAETIAGLARPPRVLVSASAVGIYGDRGDDLLTEADGRAVGPAKSFVQEVGAVWEACTAPVEQAGVRVVRLRIGIVLSPAGGALAAMLPAFLAGAGGPLGSGRQYMSWISLDDVVGAIHHALFTESLAGPVNATGPLPVTNAAFTAMLGRVLVRPAILPVPAAALRLLFGQMADELLLASARVVPTRLKETGYDFRQPTLEAALRHGLGR